MRLRDPPADGCIDQLLFREVIAATVFLENQGLVAHPGIVSIFGDHIESGLLLPLWDAGVPWIKAER